MMAGNWKMNCDSDEAWDLAVAIADELEDVEGCKVLVCPPLTALTEVEEALDHSTVLLGAQDIYWEDSGAFTGEVSGAMLVSCGCDYVIVGHSERRGRFGEAPEEDPQLLTVFGDNDATVNRKALAALRHELIPIICCGELLAERQAGDTDEVVVAQIRGAVEGMDAEDLESVIFAYEPVWAIGTGEVCDAEEANRVCGLIRSTVAEIAGEEVAEEVLVLYGGSVKPDNVEGLMQQSDIDGGLVGGASLKAESFCQLVRVAAEVKG
jgi:triosephosphate isomerase